ncbi:MAG: ABC transporter permease, partial [Proteobacteria bacterium]|nr:ABC transporter permease [Pseudomonadota bacterium]
ANEEPLPTSVQQSVPAYSLFAMFFVVIPLSGTFIRERQEGSFLRLQSMPVSPWIHMIGKVVPFFIINQIQIILMFLVGIYVIPLFGGDSLTLGDSYLGIAMITVSASIAAIGFGLLVAVFSKTTEQATTFGGISVIIFSALGGIMVPKFLMPDFMQQLANISPLSWGLESFFDLFVRKGGVGDILQEFFMLLLFGFICTSIAVWRYHRVVR